MPTRPRTLPARPNGQRPARRPLHLGRSNRVNNVHSGPVAGRRSDGGHVVAARRRGSFLAPGLRRGDAPRKTASGRAAQGLRRVYRRAANPRPPRLKVDRSGAGCDSRCRYSPTGARSGLHHPRFRLVPEPNAPPDGAPSDERPVLLRHAHRLLPLLPAFPQGAALAIARRVRPRDRYRW